MSCRTRSDATSDSRSAIEQPYDLDFVMQTFAEANERVALATSAVPEGQAP